MFATALKRHDEKIRKEGIIQGIQKGMQQGEINKAIETAKKMLSLNYSVDDIAVITGLGRSEIENLNERE